MSMPERTTIPTSPEALILQTRKQAAAALAINYRKWDGLIDNSNLGSQRDLITPINKDTIVAELATVGKKFPTESKNIDYIVTPLARGLALAAENPQSHTDSYNIIWGTRHNNKEVSQRNNGEEVIAYYLRGVADITHRSIKDVADDFAKMNKFRNVQDMRNNVSRLENGLLIEEAFGVLINIGAMLRLGEEVKTRSTAVADFAMAYSRIDGRIDGYKVHNTVDFSSIFHEAENLFRETAAKYPTETGNINYFMTQLAFGMALSAENPNAHKDAYNAIWGKRFNRRQVQKTNNGQELITYYLQGIAGLRHEAMATVANDFAKNLGYQNLKHMQKDFKDKNIAISDAVSNLMHGAERLRESNSAQ